MTTMREGSVKCLGNRGFHRMRWVEWGDRANPRVLVCVHGLTRCGRDFDYLAERLADDYRVLCPDIVGRGRSDWLADKNDYGYDWLPKRDTGYDVHMPEGTFYLLPKSPIPDDGQFIRLLAEQKIYCLPGWIVEMPGYFRVSLTANDAMIDRALPGFAAARRQAAAFA